MSRPIKSFLGWMIFRTGAYRLLRRNHAVIVVLHRINDAYPNDPLTYTTREFERFVRFFGSFFEVIPLTELLRRLETGGEIGSSLVITFDDGYRGNATIAAPILERHGQVGCFFVTTQWIGSDHVPFWDAEKGIETQWMSWDDVRALRLAGHDVGFHTKTHPDLGVIAPDVARCEVEGASCRLDAELGEHSGLFAYPFGGKTNMSPANQALMSHLGLRCCLSAYGGTVRAGDDPLRLKRIPLSDWFLSPYQFGFELLAGRLDPG